MSIKIFNTNVLVKMIKMQSLQRQEIRYFYYWFSHKTDYYIKISDIENKIPSSIGLVKKTVRIQKLQRLKIRCKVALIAKTKNIVQTHL